MGRLLLTIIFLFQINAFAEVTSSGSGRQQPQQAGTCQPVDNPNAVASYAQTAAVCSPAVAAWGIKRLASTAAGAGMAAAGKRLAQKAAVRVGAYAAGGAGVVLTAVDVANLLTKAMKPSECDKDNKLKADLLKNSNALSDRLVLESEELIDKNGFEVRRMKFPPAYLSQSYLNKLTCVKLANMLRLKNQTQQQVWGEMLSKTRPRGMSGREYSEKIKRIREKKIPGFHAGVPKDPTKVALEKQLNHLASKGTCLPMKTLVDVACAIGNLNLLGKTPGASKVAEWMSKLSPKNRIATSGGKWNRSPRIDRLLKKPTNQMTRAEREELLSYTMSPNRSREERLEMAKIALGRDLKPGEGDAIMRVHFLCSSVGSNKEAVGKCNQRKALALKSAGFSESEIRGALMENGITGLRSEAVANSFLRSSDSYGQKTVDSLFRGAGLKTPGSPDFAKTQLGDLAEFQAVKMQAELARKAEKAFRRGDFAKGRRISAVSDEFSTELADSLIANGQGDKARAYVGQLFGSRNISSKDISQLTGQRVDPLFDMAEKSGYWNARFRNSSFDDVYDPTTRTNMNALGAQNNPNSNEAFSMLQETNRRMQELQSILRATDNPNGRVINSSFNNINRSQAAQYLKQWRANRSKLQEIVEQEQ